MPDIKVQPDQALTAYRQYIDQDPIGVIRDDSLYNSASRDQYFNYLLSEQSASTARQWDEYMDSTKYQRLVNDLKGSGLNPYWMLNNASAGAVSSNGGNSYSGSHQSSAMHHAKTRDQKTAQIATTSVVAALAVAAKVVAAMIAA